MTGHVHQTKSGTKAALSWPYHDAVMVSGGPSPVSLPGTKGDAESCLGSPMTWSSG